MIKKTLYIFYYIGILAIFSAEIVAIYNWFDKKQDLYTLILIIFSIYSIIHILYKNFKTTNCLKNINSMINSNMNDDTKLSAIDFELNDIIELLK